MDHSTHARIWKLSGDINPRMFLSFVDGKSKLSNAIVSTHRDVDGQSENFRWFYNYEQIWYNVPLRHESSYIVFKHQNFILTDINGFKKCKFLKSQLVDEISRQSEFFALLLIAGRQQYEINKRPEVLAYVNEVQELMARVRSLLPFLKGVKGLRQCVNDKYGVEEEDKNDVESVKMLESKPMCEKKTENISLSWCDIVALMVDKIRNWCPRKHCQD